MLTKKSAIHKCIAVSMLVMGCVFYHASEDHSLKPAVHLRRPESQYGSECVFHHAWESVRCHAECLKFGSTTDSSTTVKLFL